MKIAGRSRSSLPCSVALGLCALLPLAGAEAGKSKPKPTVRASSSLELVDYSTAGNRLSAFGFLSSPQKKCVAKRRIELRYEYTDKPDFVVDVARVSTHGAWHSDVPLGPDTLSGVSAFDVTALTSKGKLGKNKKLVCKKSQVALTD